MNTHVHRPTRDLASTAAHLRRVTLAGVILVVCQACSSAVVGDGRQPDVLEAAAPVIRPATSASNVPITATATCPSNGSLPYLTTDGSTPTTSSTQSASATFTTSGTLMAICAGGGYAASPVVSATYTIRGVPVAAAPVITPGTSSSATAVTATITCSSAGTIPYRTTDGSTPTTSSTQSGTATFTASGTLKAICAGGSFAPSSLRSATYTISGPPAAAAPVITPGTSSSATAITATITCSSAGTIPYRTTDGSTPTTSSTQSGTATFTASGTLKAICAGGSFLPSPLRSCTYRIVQGNIVTHGITVPTAHPRLFWTADRLAKARAWWNAGHSFTPQADDYSGTAFAHVMAGRDCRAAINWALTVQLTTSTGSACDNCRWYGEDAILVYDWCFDQMTASEVDTFTSNLNAWLTRWAGASWGGSSGAGGGFEQNNYFWGYLRNELLFGLASYPENSTVAGQLLDDALITRWQGRFLLTAGTSSRGGVAQEGSQYGDYLIGYPVVAFETAAAGGRELWEESEFHREMVFYLVYSTLYSPTASSYSDTGYARFPFSEDEKFGLGAEAERQPLGNFMLMAANRWGQIGVGRYARQWLTRISPLSAPWMRAVDQGGTGLDFSGLPLDYYASGPQYLWSHSSSSWTSGTTAFFQLGGAASNVHYNSDEGGFQLWRGGRWLSRQTVGYSDSIPSWNNGPGVDTVDAVGHNTVLVAGKGPVPQYPGTPVGLPVVKRLQSAPSFTYAAVDLSPMYRSSDSGRDNPAVVHVEREFLFVRSLETLVVLDRVQSDNASRVKTFLLHSETAPTIEDGQHVTLTVGSQALRMTTLVPTSPTMRVVNEQTSSLPRSIGIGQYRVEVDTAGPAALSYILTVLQAKDASAAALSPSVTTTASEFVVRLDGATSVTFATGGTSTGGTITLGGSTTDLRSDVQAMSVTDDGPVWGP